MVTPAAAHTGNVAVATREPYAFSAFPFPPGHFRVHRVHGREAMSKPYAFDVTVSTRALVGEDLEQLALGQRAALAIRTGSAPRVVPGVIASVRADGIRPHERAAQLTFRLVPALALLRHQRGSRIFQNVRIDEVVDQVLGPAGIVTRWDTTKNHPARPYVTQYDESDLAFVQRLLAEAGIYYYFASPAPDFDEAFQSTASAASPLTDPSALVETASSIAYPTELVVFGDDASTYPAIGAMAAPTKDAASSDGIPTLRFIEVVAQGTDGSDKVTELVPTRRVRSNVAEFRDYDPGRPQTLLVSRAGDPPPASGKDGAAEPSAKLDLDGIDTSADGALSGVAELVAHRSLETYEYLGAFLFPDWKDVADHAERIRAARSRNRATANGKSMVSAVAAGHVFALTEHPIAGLDRTYLVTAVEHRGTVQSREAVYENEFSVVAASATYLPGRPKRRRVFGPVTATVVGPSGEEVYTDDVGRVKVLFHWDRRQVRDDSASCWVRTMQLWAGAAFGHQFVPRVGMEVAVAFEGGDPDRPIVLGAIGNATHLPPFALPMNKNQSGIRTRSVGGDGYNELSFEDTATKEKVVIRAQKDLEETVLGSRTVSVGKEDRARSMGGKDESVGGNASLRVGGDKTETVDKHVAIEHKGNRIDLVRGALDQRSGARTVRVEGPDMLAVQNAAEQQYGGDLLQRVAGNLAIVVGKNEAKRSMFVRVEGHGTISTEDAFAIEAKGGLTIKVGKTIVRIGEDGIELVGKMIRAGGEKGSLEVGEDGIKMSSEKAYAHLSDKIQIKTEKTILAMDKEVKIQGDKILLNSPDQAKDEPPPEPPAPTEIELVDQDDKPLANQRFVIELEDGSQRTGVTDGKGKASMDLPSSGKIRFPDLSKVGAG